MKSGVNSQVMFKQKLHKRKSLKRRTVCILESMVGVFMDLSWDPELKCVKQNLPITLGHILGELLRLFFSKTSTGNCDGFSSY